MANEGINGIVGLMGAMSIEIESIWEGN